MNIIPDNVPEKEVKHKKEIDKLNLPIGVAFTVDILFELEIILNTLLEDKEHIKHNDYCKLNVRLKEVTDDVRSKDSSYLKNIPILMETCNEITSKYKKVRYDQ